MKPSTQSNRRNLWICVFLQIICSCLSSDEDSNKFVGLDQPFASSVFSNIDHFPCVTLYHRNGRIGCGTLDRENSPESSILYWKNVIPSNDQSNDNDNDEVVSYVAVMTDFEYTNENMESLLALDAEDSSISLQGVLILNHTVSEDQITPTSPESMYPQGYNTPSANLAQFTNNQYAWNPTGDSNMYQDYYGIPSILISNKELSSYIYTRAKQQSLTMDGSKVVATFNYYMGPQDSTSIECLSWKDTDDTWSPKCLPLGGNSIWSATGSPPPSPNSNDKANDDQNNNDNDNEWNARDVILLATSIDATAAFHDASTGASTAASNIMTLLLTAYHIGNISWQTLDSFSKQIVFGFFQGESYGFMGSRNFIKDQAYPGFQCNSLYNEGCTYPIRPTMNFQNLGNIVGMIAVDQVGILETEKSFYIHTDGNGDDLENVVLQFTAQNDDDNDNFEYDILNSNVEDAIPPSPLTSLIELSQGTVGGVVLTGYDETYVNSVYESHLDSVANVDINIDAIQNAALLLARSAVAAAYLGEQEDDDNDDQDAIQAALALIPQIDQGDEEYANLVQNLYDCLFMDGMCKFWQKYTDTEQKNEKDRTGIDLGKQTYRVAGTIGAYGKATPNYYVNVYNLYNGQPVVQVNGEFHAAYDGDIDENNKKSGDGTYVIKPSALEAGIYGLLNNFLGRTISSSSDDNDQPVTLSKCTSTSDCSKVSYCPNSYSSVCTGGGQCVCGPSSFYHIAIDESIEAALNTTSGQFKVIENDEGITPIYTEPYWSASVGVTLYQDAGEDVGTWILVGGVGVSIASVIGTFLLRKKLVKMNSYKLN